MRFFIAYRHSGADLSAARRAVDTLQAELGAMRHSSYCTLSDGADAACSGNAQAVLDLGVRELAASDALLLYVESEQPSLGMYIEVGVALARGLPVYLLQRSGIEAAYLGALSLAQAQFTDEAELGPALRRCLNPSQAAT